MRMQQELLPRGKAGPSR